MLEHNQMISMIHSKNCMTTEDKNIQAYDKINFVSESCSQKYSESYKFLNSDIETIIFCLAKQTGNF